MKVGKAIYNILSQSTDVQSNFPFNTTDYSPTGTELVTNGDFSAAGSNLVDNPNFTEGVEQLTQPIDLTVDFSGNSGGVIDDSNSFTTSGGALDGIRNKIGTFDLIDGKSYKLVIEGSTTSSGLTIGNINLGNEYGTGFGTHYFVATGTYSTTLWIRQQTAGTTDLTTFTIKELGEDWDDSGTPLKAATFDANGLTITSVNGDGNNNRVSQANVTDDAKSYKVTYTIHSVTLTGTNVFQYYNGSTYVTFSEQGVGTHTFYFTRQSTDDNWYFRLETSNGSTTDFVTISSLVVQELGEGWTVVDGAAGDTVTFGDSFAQFNKTDSQAVYLQQDYALSLGVYHKLKYTILSNTYTGGGTELGVSSVGAYGQSAIASTVGTHTVYLKVTNTTPTASLRFYSNDTGGSLKITDISVEEMVLNKIFPELAPPDIDAPYVVYSVVSNSPSDTKNANGDIDTASIEVYGFQDTYNKAVDLGVSVRAALDRKTGTYNTIEIQSTNYVNEQMDVNEARKLWAAIQDYSIRIKNL